MIISQTIKDFALIALNKNMILIKLTNLKLILLILMFKKILNYP